MWFYVDNPPYFSERDYEFFAILADVRNGYGFAGVKTFDPIKPLTSFRGLPDFIEVDKDFYTVQDDFWFGDHSHGYITLAELNIAIDEELHLQETTKYGIFDEQEYKDFKNGEVYSYSGVFQVKEFI